MQPGQTYWGHAKAKDADGWVGAYATREEAIEHGRRSHTGDFWVACGPAITPTIEAEDLAEVIKDHAFDMIAEEARAEAIWSDEPIIIDDPDKTLRALLSAWISEHVKPQAWTMEMDTRELVPAKDGGA